jgi:type IV secretory pathway TraG/TraD family ATPase VirD4
MDPKTPPRDDLYLIVLGLGCLFAILAKPTTSFISKCLNSWGLRLSAALIIGALVCAIYSLAKYSLRKKRNERASDARILGPAEGAVFCGHTKHGEAVFIKKKQRIMHTQVVGTTNAGKTESVILPWAIQDIEQGRGFILIDGKSDRGLLNKLWSYTVKHQRQNDFKLFSLSCIQESQSFNPLIQGSPEEIAERVFSSFTFENEFYRSIQFEVLAQVLRIFRNAGESATFLKLHQAISNPVRLQTLLNKAKDPDLSQWFYQFRNLPSQDREQRTSGLLSQMSHFAFGGGSKLFNTSAPAIDIQRALENNQIIYFQLPVLLSPFLGSATGKLVLQSLQSAIASRHRSGDSTRQFFSVFLDDFTEYLYPGFVSILNKSRSANIGVVFAHQALGDIESLGDSVANAILTNSNLKIFMRGNDPKSAEYFSKVVGTKTGTKITERRKLSLLKNTATGDVSARDVEEFMIHPNHFKRVLGVGEAVMVVPHDAGAKTVEVKFEMYPDLPVQPIPAQDLPKPEGLTEIKEKHSPSEEGITEVLNRQKKEPYAVSEKTDLRPHCSSSRDPVLAS